MNLGTALREVRKKKNITQNQVRDKLKVSQTYLSLIESDKKEPSGAMLRKLCTLYETPVMAIFWLSLTEKEIRKDRVKEFRSVKGTIDQLIKEFI